ncbi:efflux RND transporter periplasmic adaptor subunit [Ferruginibacter lapsinanis]|uniref:efflux RND transporter periplasmic adaptor subunit n=1 Tax=Ferruginibacter lapsinanis TaxID=563172 RepID=UPI001E41F38D|nr:efflux RND transporter periplasmic adaptor subunit [Ferruginibacter lapsinanis]UEG49726.1 efflux RND transporter periplasmic adaptor subunit [Ferruginibacter lapsinanis]
MNRIVWLISLCTLIYSTGCKTKTTEKEEAVKYTVTSALKADTSFTKDYIAQIQSVRNIEVRAQEKGYLENIYVDEGQYVKAGQVLFRIMPKMYEAEFLKAQAEAKAAELEMLNTKMLADKNIVSKTELSIAQAKLDEAKAEMSLAQVHLSLTEIKAPFDGVIDRIRFKLGSLIDEGGLLTTLSDNKSVYAYFNVSESEYLNFKTHNNAGDKPVVSLLLANNEMHKYKGEVETIESEFDNATGNIAFRAKFPNPDMLLKHGETGKVQMTIPINNALIIPQKATYEMQDNIYVYVVDQNNVVKAKKLTIRNKMPDLYVVDSGITENDKILLEGVQNVKEDDKINYQFITPDKVISNLQLIK